MIAIVTLRTTYAGFCSPFNRSPELRNAHMAQKKTHLQAPVSDCSPKMQHRKGTSQGHTMYTGYLLVFMVETKVQRLIMFDMEKVRGSHMLNVMGKKMI